MQRVVMYLSVLLFTASALQATELSDSYQLLCDKVKSCALADMADMPAENRAMMEPMLNNMCVAMQKNFQQATGHAALEKSASACIRSLAKLDCQAFNGNETAECQAFEKKAGQYQATLRSP
ncbi:MAG: hypothetical protein HRU20_29550 [Pseudomonadales bacterium]|nr:hypothetical protein [Pseudomonadales bacterium]